MPPKIHPSYQNRMKSSKARNKHEEQDVNKRFPQKEQQFPTFIPYKTKYEAY